MITIESSVIVVSLSCDECGHGWDIEDRDTLNVHTAENDAEDGTCPKCGGNE